MICGFDLETNGLNPFKEGAKILTAVAWQGEHKAIQCSHPTELYEKDTDWIEWVVEDPTNLIMGHNIGFDILWWETHVGPVRAQIFDTMVAQTLLDENLTPNSLDNLSQHYLGYQSDTMKTLRGSLEHLPIEDVLDYNVRDSKKSYELGMLLRDQIHAEGFDTLMAYQMQLLRTLVNMQKRGVRVDLSLLNSTVEDLQTELDAVEGYLQWQNLQDYMARGELEDGGPPEEEYWDEINLGSPKQVGEWLHEWRGLPAFETSEKTGLPKTGIDTLRKLKAMVSSEAGQVIDGILEYRKLAKLKGTYLEPFRDEHLCPDGKIHGSYHVGRSSYGGTVTGRLSSSKPNLQNIPQDKRVKNVFVPQEGWKLFEADYAQLEMRVAGYLSRDEGLLEAFRNGEDMHTSALARIEGVSYGEALESINSGDAVWKKKRTAVKTVNFSILYGAGPNTVQESLTNLGVSMGIGQVRRLMSDWRETFHHFAQWEEAVKFLIDRDDELVSELGRVRRFGVKQGLVSPGRAHRQGVNFLIQSFASEMTNLALINLEEAFSEVGCAEVLMTVHDSIVGHYDPNDWLEREVVKEAKHCMGQQVVDILKERFDLARLEDLYLEVDIETNLPCWGYEEQRDASTDGEKMD